MTSDVVLTAALRSNLLSLQGTQTAIDGAQFRLSTGRKVNSALDNPQSFFASRALNNRASDLTRLLDSIGQSIQVIKAADNGITALTKLVEQADSLASQAQDALAQGTSEAKVVGNKDLRGINDMTTVPGIAAGDTLTFTLTDEDGQAEQIGNYSNVAASAVPSVSVAINALDSIDEIIGKINNIQVDDGNDVASGGQAFEAKLNDKGQLEIRTLNGGNFKVVFAGGGGTGDTDSEDLALATAIGFGGIAKSSGNQDLAGNTSIEFTAVADVALRSYSMVKNATGDVADRSTLLSDLRDGEVPGTLLFGGIDSATDFYEIAINGQGRQTIKLTDAGNTNAITVQGFIDSINNNSTLNTKIEAAFDEATGQVSIRALDASVKSIEIGVVGEDGTEEANFGFGTTDLQATAANDAMRENIQIGASAGQLAKLEQDFNKIRDQIDLLVEDTGYRGTNLLKGDDLLTVFNEFRTSSISTKGVEFTASGLGLEEADFSRAASVEDVLGQVRSALESVRDFGSTLANDLNVIQTRQTFTQELINTLKAGSDALTVADQNEEGAKLLALQTRQQLGVTSLSLASQSQQSILRLF